MEGSCGEEVRWVYLNLNTIVFLVYIVIEGNITIYVCYDHQNQLGYKIYMDSIVVNGGLKMESEVQIDN